MGYILYSLPNCLKCSEVKEYLKQKGIKYEEVNAGLGEGMKKFRDFYSKNKDRIQRENDGAISLPVFVNNGNIFQGLEKIITSLN